MQINVMMVLHILHYRDPRLFDIHFIQKQKAIVMIAFRVIICCKAISVYVCSDGAWGSRYLFCGHCLQGYLRGP